MRHLHADDDEIDLGMADQFIGGAERMGNAVFLGGGLGDIRPVVADCGQAEFGQLRECGIWAMVAQPLSG